MSRQLKTSTQALLHHTLNEKIDSAKHEISKLSEIDTDQSKKDQVYLRGRISQLQLSLRLTMNTNWLKEQREDYIRTLRTRLEEETEMPKQDRILLTQNLGIMKRAYRCNKSGCWGRGWIGLNKSTGEFSLCNCTNSSLHLHNLH